MSGSLYGHGLPKVSIRGQSAATCAMTLADLERELCSAARVYADAHANNPEKVADAQQHLLVKSLALGMWTDALQRCRKRDMRKAG